MLVLDQTWIQGIYSHHVSGHIEDRIRVRKKPARKSVSYGELSKIEISKHQGLQNRLTNADIWPNLGLED